jgi:hypothetical protein
MNDTTVQEGYHEIMKYSPWHPITNPKHLKCLGKLGEELGECSAATNRCIIQGIDEVEPVTKKQNRLWLEEEIADVLVNIDRVMETFNLDQDRIQARAERKRPLIAAWQEQA